MRTVLALITGVVLFQAPLAKADDDYNLDDGDDAAQSEMVDAPVAPRVAGWNRWNCTAHGGPLQIRIFRGSSYYFRQGSGEGQVAKGIAQKIAVRNCEFAGVVGCASNVSQCTVETH